MVYQVCPMESRTSWGHPSLATKYQNIKCFLLSCQKPKKKKPTRKPKNKTEQNKNTQKHTNPHNQPTKTNKQTKNNKPHKKTKTKIKQTNPQTKTKHISVFWNGKPSISTCIVGWLPSLTVWLADPVTQGPHARGWPRLRCPQTPFPCSCHSGKPWMPLDTQCHRVNQQQKSKEAGHSLPGAAQAKWST